jgi:hypothetical protein
MTMKWNGIALALAAATFAACGTNDNSGDQDASTDTGTDTDTDTESDTDEDAGCPSLLEEACEVDAGAEMEVYVSADDLGVSRFVDLADLALLAETPWGGTALFVPNNYVPDGENPQWEAVDVSAATAMQPVALADGYVVPDSAWVALLCEGDNRTCSFWQASETTLTKMENGDVPTEGELRGATSLFEYSGGTPTTLCAFGDGLYCFDGTTWTTEIEAGTAPLFNDFHCSMNDLGDYDRCVAVGDGGRRAIRASAAEEWVDGFADTCENLLSLSAMTSVAGGSGGILYGLSAYDVACSAVVGLSGEYDVDPDTGTVQLAAVTRSGIVFYTRYDPTSGVFSSLECGGVVASGGALAVQRQFCGIMPNLLVLTKSALLSNRGWECAED